MKIVAIDYGEKRIGMAVSDPDGKIALALPLYMAQGNGADADRLAELIREQEAGTVVIGLPINMDGTEGPAVERVRAFAEELKETLELPVEFVDERLTSEEAQRRLRDTPMTRRKKKEHVNTVSAMILLETFLKGD